MTSPIPISMPRLSDSMEEGTLLRWIKKEGQTVNAGEELAEIESDKATVVYVSETGGVLTTLVREGETVAVGTAIGWLRTEAGVSSATESETDELALAHPPTPVSAVANASVAQRNHAISARPKASPVARRMAASHGLDLEHLEGTGPGGRITRNDVVLRIASVDRHPSPTTLSSVRGEVTTQALTRIQMLLAERLTQARDEIPDFELRMRVDAGAMVALREQLKAGVSAVVPSINDFVVAAAAVALREEPRANGAHRGNQWELYGRINVGIAVATDQGLVVPTIFDADQKSLAEIAQTSRELSTRAREGRITPADLDGATFTVSNLGMFGVDSFSAVIPVRHAAILAVGAVVRVPVVREDQILPGHVFDLTLACDHRILYGADGARMLARIRDILERPLNLFVR
jgi:pyruvate dehydrogenase E2 component (dihydrolipoamide acetyltransferase)